MTLTGRTQQEGQSSARSSILLAGEDEGGELAVGGRLGRQHVGEAQAAVLAEEDAAALARPAQRDAPAGWPQSARRARCGP